MRYVKCMLLRPYNRIQIIININYNTPYNCIRIVRRKLFLFYLKLNVSNFFSPKCIISVYLPTIKRMHAIEFDYNIVIIIKDKSF